MTITAESATFLFYCSNDIISEEENEEKRRKNLRKL